MEATSLRRKIGGRSPRNVVASRRGSYLVAAAAALLAGVLLFAFVQQYKKDHNGTVPMSTAFIAARFIPRGTSASLIAQNGLMERTRMRSSQIQSGAINDPAVVHGQVTTEDIYPGQQLTASDFTSSDVTVASQLTGTDRAIAVPVDTAHGLVGFLHPGDHVDVLASFTGGGSGGTGVVTTLDQNVLVLATTGGSGGIGNNNSNNVLLRVSDKIALSIAFAADNGKVWVTLRPPVGATNSVPATPGPVTAPGSHKQGS